MGHPCMLSETVSLEKSSTCAYEHGGETQAAAEG